MTNGDLPYPSPGPLSVAQFRELDRRAVDVLGVDSIVLMENAGRNAAGLIYALLPPDEAAQIAVLCGPGNNGGDGYVIARQLSLAGAATVVITAVPFERLAGDAAKNAAIWHRLGGPTLAAHDPARLGEIETCLDRAAVCVDALLGTGSAGPPRGVAATLIERANSSRAVRVAIDIPTGLSADDGVEHSPCFRADYTITMAAPKLGFANATCVGRVRVVSIGVPANFA